GANHRCGPSCLGNRRAFAMSARMCGFHGLTLPSRTEREAVQEAPVCAQRSGASLLSTVLAVSRFPMSVGLLSRARLRQGGILAALFASLAAGIWFGRARAAEQAESLPELTQLAFDEMLPPLRAAVQKAYDEVRAHPQHAEANGKLGMILHANNFPAQAEIFYRRARLLNPTSLRWTYYLALVQVDQRKCGDAISMFGEALRIDPNYFPAQLRMGECLLVSSEWEEAEKLYEAILQTHPESAEAYYGLGRVRAARQQLPEAIDSFRKACELFPKFSAAHFALARAYRRAGSADQAE